MSEVIAQLGEATWIPSARRRLLADLASGRPDPVVKELLRQVLESRQTAAAEFLVEVLRLWLGRDTQHRLTPEVLRHVIAAAGAKVVGAAGLRKALEALLGASGEAAVAEARARLLALETADVLANAHGIYVAAARKASPAARPTTPVHLGGPMPELSVFETAELTISLAALAQTRRPVTEAPELLDQARATLAWARAGKVGKQPPGTIPPTAPARGPAFALARAALKEAKSTDHVSGRGTSIKSGVVYGLQLGDERWWLEQVDEQVMLCDARTAWERRGQATSKPIERLLFRGGDATSRLWVVRLKGGRHALLAKLGRTWASHEGDLESVCATIPEAWFARAMKVIETRK